ncbi:MAG: hydrogenase maturation nickel metallochaperone HypA [Coriobacteriia bacterium]|jgi:hydrogenase nickel incorporation protein HypA/HybF|nr:hydrogenase maturation nickel metallochaperone HypA [Coriobacteriia bacterium]
MSVVSGILTASVETAARMDAVRIKEIHVRVGDLTEIVDDAMFFAFEALTPGTLAEGAKLFIEHVSGRSECVECGTSFKHGRFDVECPDCGSYFCSLVEGRELEIESIDVDLPEAAQSEVET